MRIGLIDIEPKVFNTAYMQISQYHKDRGDSVEWWSPLTDSQFDHVYCSSLFDFTNKCEVPERAICGGTGFDITSRLSIDIENCDLDYSIYPKCKTSYIWFSRGCNQNCPFCIVRQKEGRIHPVKYKNLNPIGGYITINDNSFLENPKWKDALYQIRLWEELVDIQAVNASTATDEQWHSLRPIKIAKQLKIAWDFPDNTWLPKRLNEVVKIFPAYKLMCYVLIGYWSTPEEDLYRVETLRKLKIDPFVMPYNKKDLYQKRFARWVNYKAIFKTVKWKDYN